MTMGKKLLEFNIPHPLPEDYDPILGRSVGEVRNPNSSAPVATAPNNDNVKSSVFDDPELDFAYQSPIKEELPQLSAEDIAIILDEKPESDAIVDLQEPTEENGIVTEADETALVSEEEFVETNQDDAETTALPQSEILSDDVELDPEITPFETMDGAANEAIDQAEEENNLSERWRMSDDELLEEQKEEIIANAPESILESIPESAPENTKEDAEEDAEDDTTVNVTESDNEETQEQISELVVDETTDEKTSDDVVTAPETAETETEELKEETASSDEPVAISDEVETLTQTDAIEETTENEIAIEQNQVEETSAQPAQSEAEPAVKATSALFNEPILVPPPQPKKRRPKGKKRRKVKIANEIALMGGVFFSGMAILLLISTLAAPLGRPFSDIASYGIIWSGFALIGAAIWAYLRNWQMAIASLLCLLGFVVNIVPTLGDAPIGGTGETNIVGWANVENSPKALQSFVTQGEKNGATLLIVAGANKLIAGDIPNWTVIQVPIANDPTSLAVLAKENWRAVTLPGEPTMARPMDNSLTVIGVNPSLGAPKENAIINRAANRMGDQETAVLTVGDFGLVPWDRTMKDFTKTSGAKRVRCGGILGTTYNQGLLNIATDHAFGFNAKIQSCDIGDNLPQSHHKPLFVKVLKH